MELTCGNEQNFADQEKRKMKRYQQLTEEIEANGWACKLQTVEVGARGIYNYSLPTFMNHLNVNNKEKKKACMKIAEISLRASYTIYLSRNNTIWTDDWELVKRPIMIIRCTVLVALTLWTAEAFIKPKCRGIWSDWGKWRGLCSESCSGHRTRTRDCVNNGLFYCGDPTCSGDDTQRERCGGDRTNGGWSEWSVPECRYCGQKRLRTRKCDSPRPSCGGRKCRGKKWEVTRCGQSGCPGLEGNLIVQQDDHSCGATITVSCPQCHRLEGSPKLRCLPDGLWNKNSPQCVPLDGIQAQWSAFGPWDDHCRACNQVITRRRTCQSVCGEVCRGDAVEQYICGSAGCSINAFIHRSTDLVSSKDAFMCAETATLRCRSPDKVLQGNALLTCGLGGWEGTLPRCVDESCSPIPHFDNGRVMSTGLTYGKFTHFMCNDGYELQGQQYLVCLGTDWSYSFPTCVKKVDQCVELQLTEHHIKNSSSVDIGAAIEISCVKGYETVGVSDLFCLDGGLWSSDIPDCDKITCITLPEMEHALVTHSESGNRVEVSCEKGYQLSGAAVLECTESGEWSSGIPSCQPNICQLPSTNNGLWYRVADRHIALLRCDRGYSVEGDSELLCGEDNNWTSANIGRCVLRQCAVLGAVDDGVLSTNETAAGTVVEITCNEGYARSGHWKLTCLSNGGWDYPAPDCRVTECQTLPGIENGYVSSQRFVQGSVVEIICEPGYRLIGQRSLKCLKSGDWSAEMPRCDLFGCVTTDAVQNGSIASDIIPLNRDSWIVCQEGFQLEGEEAVTCTEGGILQISPLSRCIPQSCDLFSAPNGDVIIEDVILGSRAQVTCHYGYRRSGLESVTCQSNGEWSGLLGCEKILCPQFPVLYKGYIEGSGHSVGDSASLICEIGFVPSDADHITCTEEGRWSNVDRLGCVDNGCPSLQRPHHGMFISVPGPAISLFCNDGYKVMGSKILSCSDGRWNSTIPICGLDVQCPKLIVPFAGTLSSNSTEYGTQVTVECANSHVLSHADPIFCNSSGLWNGSLPSCNFPDCPDLSSLDGVTLTGTSVGDTASLDCGSCKKSKGEKHSVCTAGGVWDPPLGRCQNVICKTKINRRLYESVEGGIPTKCGKSVSFVCKPGYTTIGRTTITCYDTGQYDYHVPFCVESGIFRVRRQRRKRDDFDESYDHSLAEDSHDFEESHDVEDSVDFQDSVEESLVTDS
ncbi:sushi, von Willebrand factor type A, EGF and pentraxin domain-containing protein 1-like [Bolinopsis microptera]|uniref:sushi, von Willebrand factor type A, EGF and pentraxin domain-containing protein 1-like n=1 Tax=Bolinopsis microptera TaxID=2820187 RepID=UPI003079FE02